MTRLRVPGRTNARQHTDLSALNEISRKLDRLRTFGGGGTPITGFSTEANQLLILSELQAILAKPDTEIIESIGIDSNILTTLSISTPTSDSLGIGGGTSPSITNVTTSSFTYSEVNRNYEIVVPITTGIPTSGVVDIFIRYDQSSTNPGNDGGSFTLYDDTRTNVLDSTSSTSFSSITGSSQIIQLSFNNSAGLTSVNLVLRSIPSTTGYPASYDISFLGSTPSGFNPTNLIRRRDRFENNIQVSTEYLNALDQPYTLVGIFLRDSNKSTEKRLSNILNSIDSKISTSTNQTSQISAIDKTNLLLENQEAALIRLEDVESGTVPTFPFSVDTLGVSFITITEIDAITSTVVNNMGELVTLWNDNIDAVKIEELNASTFKMIPGTNNLPTQITDSIVLNDGATLRTWRKAVFIPTVLNEAEASSTDKTVEQLRTSFLFDQYANWEYIKGNEKSFTYYAGTTNIENIIFINNGVTYLTQTLTYDANNNIINIATT